MADLSPAPAALLADLTAAVGVRYVLTKASQQAPFFTEQRGHYHGAAIATVRPGSTDEVARVVRACRAHGAAIIPQAGNTGLVGGAVATDASGHVIVSVERLDSVHAIDQDGFTMTVGAGCILAGVKAVAAEADRLFPLSLAAEGSARIGGLLSTNAGGTMTIRHGNARDLVLGLEVVLPNGDILSDLNTLRKNNTGYDLKHLFMGAEGTLGIITAAVLKLSPRPRGVASAFIAVPSPTHAVALLGELRSATADGIRAFELMAAAAVEMALTHIPCCRAPLAEPYPWYVLLDVVTQDDDSGAAAALEQALGAAFESGTVLDASVAQNEAQRDAFWRIRESIPEAQKLVGASIKHDIAVAVSAVPALLNEGTALAHSFHPGMLPVPFGHLGDGNIHFNFSQPPGMDPAAFMALAPALNTAIHDLVVARGGSFSAEHGVGRLKVGDLQRYKDPVALSVMQALKTALDPDGLMNPGAVLVGSTLTHD
jgi:FAD/FMN-containing dehydrogenase